jgi:osmotically-inducible protein OsmY
MFGSQVSDKELSKDINKRLVRVGAPTKVMATVGRGMITLTGQLKYENQRKQIVKAVRGTPGAQQVIDHLQSPPKHKPV